MIGDIDDQIQHPLLSRLLKVIKNSMDTSKQQRDLNKAYELIETNHIELNRGKFEHLCYGKNIQSNSLSNYLGTTGTASITKKEQETTLGF